MSICARDERNTRVISCWRPSYLCQTSDARQILDTDLGVGSEKRGEALNPRILVVYLGFYYQSVHEAERQGFTVKPTAKYMDEWLDIV